LASRQQATDVTEGRGEHRDEVHHRTRIEGPDGRSHPALLVNISARGLMARSDAPLALGDRIRVQLPVLGAVAAEIRWALGGRIGCELDTAIPLADYYTLLAATVRG
jgi:hypothetical protein